MALGKRLINTGAAAAVCNTDSVQAFGADSAYSSNIALYQLDGNANDTTGDYNGTASNVTYATGQFGQAAVFNGTNSLITLPSNTDFDVNTTGQFSISAWIKPNDITSQDPIFSRITSTNPLSGVHISYRFRLNATGFPEFTQSNGSAAVSTCTSPVAANEGQWNHVVGTVTNGGNVNIYLNGVLQNTVAAQANTLTNAGWPVRIGGYGASFRADAEIDQVRIFNRAITPEEVSTLYNETTSTASNTNPLSDGSGVALYSLDYDASDAGGLYDGTPTNVDFGVDGQINYGARFNGSSSVINISSTATTPFDASSEDYAISMWVNVSTFANDKVFIAKWGATDSIRSYWLGLQGSSGDNTKIAIYERSGSTTSTFNGTTSLAANTWYHIVYVRNATQVLLYIDGVEQTFSATNSINQGGTNNVTIGQYSGLGSSTINGTIDQVRVFSKALSSDEVDTLYAETACVYTSTTDIVNYPTGTTPVAYYKLDNSSEDYSTGGNDGTDTNVEYRFGRFGQAAVFNGSSSYTSSSNILDTSSAFSYSLWIKPNTIANYDYLIGHQQAGSPYTGVGLIGTVSNTFSLALAGSAPQVMTPTLTLNNWTHLVLTHDGSGNYTCYTNNNGSPITYSGATSNNSSNPFRLGFSSVSGWGYYDGSIDQVRIYDAALTSSQVTELYNEKPEVDTSNFKTVLWKGNNTTGHFINNVGMDLETNGGLVWIKSRNDTDNHIWQDNVRGITNYIMSSNTLQQSNSDMVVSLEKTGFVLGADTPTGVNTNNVDFVGWVFKGGGDAVNIAVNSITASTPSIASDVSANTDAGFSIVKYTGNSTDNATVGTGLSSAAELVIVKDLDSSNYWCVGGSTVGDGENLYLNVTTERQTRDRVKSVQTDTFTLGSHFEVNSTNDFIAYCFHSVSGYSKIGSYEGNTTTLPSITLGFKPSFVMVKNVDGGDNWHRWYMFDDKRQSTNSRNLAANVNSNEPVNNDAKINFEANGFSIANSSNYLAINDNGDTYLYMAFK